MFDKKFWKMFSGFMFIIAMSTIVIFGTRVYQEKQAQNQLQKSSQANTISATQ